MKTLLLSLLVLSQVVFGCGLPTELDDSDCGIIYMGSWEAIEGGYHIALTTTDLPSMEGYLHPQEDGIYDIYEDHFDLPNRTKVLYSLYTGEGYLAEVDQRLPSSEAIFKNIPLKRGPIKIKLEVLPPNIEEGKIVIFDKLRLVKVK